MTPQPPTLEQLLIIVDRAERGVILPAEAAALRMRLRELHNPSERKPQ